MTKLINAGSDQDWQESSARRAAACALAMCKAHFPAMDFATIARRVPKATNVKQALAETQGFDKKHDISFFLAIVPAFKRLSTTGKKKGTTGSSASAGATKISLDWCASTISNREVNRLRTLGFISSADSDIRLLKVLLLCSPPSCFVGFLSLPTNSFALFFSFYGIQLWKQTPNSILHLSIFITLCEAFLGIDPHWGLWRKIFYVKIQNGNDAPPPPLLAVSVLSSERRSTISTTR
ncbi:hypothetical protein QYE76_022035 [Lolium multiflorum]|uniref:Transposase (putative) gypsy type domain-containing protein n=1 Tax=Lolium multiflorum TaxID=4521 RepID=A0AAD8VTS2_LOLMU|nr:hypothetical protein QYE76_022035 [Lolium multiflorum]